jgi:hemerythrin
MDEPNTTYRGYSTCYRLLDELNNLIKERKSKADIQDVVRRLFIVVAINFARDERSYTKFEYFDALSIRELHSTILAKFLRLSDELDRTIRADDCIDYASLIASELTKDMKKKQHKSAA